MSCFRKSRTTPMMSWPTWSANPESVTETMLSCRLWPKQKPPWSFFLWMGSSAWMTSSHGILSGWTPCQPIQKMKVRVPSWSQKPSGVCPCAFYWDDRPASVYKIESNQDSHLPSVYTRVSPHLYIPTHIHAHMYTKSNNYTKLLLCIY